MNNSLKKWVMAALVVILVAIPGTFAYAENDMTEIYTVEDLRAIDSNPTGNYILMNDIDLTGETWVPLCTFDVGGFGGIFDGNNKTISGLTVPDFEDDAGLFSVTHGATIKNLNIEGASVNNSNLGYGSGLLIGWCDSSRIENCRVTGQATGDWAGGIAANAFDSTITNCYAKVTLSGTTALGGIAGALDGSNIISYCYAETTDATPPDQYPFAGALVGSGDGNPTYISVRFLIGPEDMAFAVGYFDPSPSGTGGLDSQGAKDSSNFPGFDSSVWTFGENGPELKAFFATVLPAVTPPINLRWNGGLAEWDDSPEAISYTLYLYRPDNPATDNYVAEEIYTGTDLSFDLTAHMQTIAQEFFDALPSYDARGRISLYFSVRANGDPANFSNSDSAPSSYVYFYYLKGFDDDLALRLPVGTNFADAGLPSIVQAKSTGLYSIFTRMVDADVVWDEAAYDSSQATTIELSALSYSLPFNVVEKSGYAGDPKITVTFYEPDSVPGTTTDNDGEIPTQAPGGLARTNDNNAVLPLVSLLFLAALALGTRAVLHRH